MSKLADCLSRYIAASSIGITHLYPKILLFNAVISPTSLYVFFITAVGNNKNV